MLKFGGMKETEEKEIIDWINDMIDDSEDEVIQNLNF